MLGRKSGQKKDPNWVKVRVEKIHYGKVGTVRISHYYLGHFSELLLKKGYPIKSENWIPNDLSNADQLSPC